MTKQRKWMSAALSPGKYPTLKAGRAHSGSEYNMVTGLTSGPVQLSEYWSQAASHILESY